MTEAEPLQQIQRTYVRFRNRKLSYFSGCDYFRLASHPKVIAALETGVRKYGLNVAASRMTTGNHILYGELEEALCNFFDAEEGILTSGGYITNLIAAQALSGNFSHALVDQRSHPSLSDAARFLDCPVLQFKHRSTEDLARTVKRCGPEAKLIVLTDGMFSHDGSAVPLRDYLGVLPSDAMLLVDDAHGAGVLGKSGKGALEHAGVSRRGIIQTITLSKAFGSYGGAILTNRAFRKRVLEKSKLFAGNTPLPLPLANAALQAVQILKSDGRLRKRLATNARFLKKALGQDEVPQASAFNSAGTRDTPGPILSLLPKRRTDALRLKKTLLEHGVFPPFIIYPGGPPEGYFRFVISSEHSQSQLERLIGVVTSSIAQPSGHPPHSSVRIERN
jgi:8-amino-7-oxononanoate synthase